MALKKILFLIAAFIGISAVSIAQKGNIRGTVIDDESGEPLFGVTVVIKGTTIGSVTDFEGEFDIAADPGSYDLQVSFVSYQTVAINEVVVTGQQVTLLEVIRLAEDIQQLQEIVIEADVIIGTEEALLTIKKKAPNLLDGISSTGFRKIGDSDAATAVTRVPGVSVEGGKYVYVRGLGDRYTKSILNGVDIPGLDPDRNTLQMDIFPTSVIDNIVVLKSFTSDLPSDFVGGLVNLELKDFPEEKAFKVSAGVGYTPNMHFNRNYLTYKGGKTDWLGFDDGTRAIPTAGLKDIPNGYASVVGRPDSPEGQVYRGILERFNPTLGASNQRSFMDYNMGLSLGNQIPRGKNKFGYNLALTYKSGTKFYQDALYGRYGLNQQDASILEMEQREIQIGNFGVNSVLLGGIAGLAYKTDRSKFRLNLLHLQNGESKTGLFAYRGSDQGSVFDGIQTNLEYNQRSLSNLLLNGSHFNSDGSWELDWKVSPTISRLEDPDIRFTRLRTDNGQYQTGTESGLPERIWRSLEEYNLVSKIDLTRKHQIAGEESKLRFGGSYIFKERDYLIQGFQINPRGVELQNGYPAPPSFEGEPGSWGVPNPIDIPADEIFRASNLWPSDASGFSGTTYDATFIPDNPNEYRSSITNLAFYVSEEVTFFENLKGVIGLRMEDYTQRYTGQNQLGTITLEDSLVIEELGFYPTANVIYSLSDRQNLRLSYSRTTARPSFKEASYAEILDPISGRVFIGGFFADQDIANNITIWDGNLRTTSINNFDIRWEMFRQRGQTYSISLFYKSFENPIEIVQYATLANSFQPRNVGDGNVAGVELEFRQQLLSDLNNGVSVNGNLTFTRSQILMSDTEYSSRLANAREGQEISRNRDMAGQAPYIINLGLGYQGFENGVEAGLYYNVQGETLQFVGIVDRPDVYTRPFHSLNFTASRTFGDRDRMRLGIKAKNLLDQDREEVFDSYGASSQVFGKLSPGRSFDLSLGYSF